MKALVTGVAGFIGSHIAERLVSLGYQVIGVDCFTDYYAREIKKSNIADLIKSPAFRFIEGNLLHLDLPEITAGCDYIFHQAAQAGVRASWGDSFQVYTDNNILATQKLLEAAARRPVEKFIYASSSSVYGNPEEFPVCETTLPRPFSPYGVSKLAGEHLAGLYWANYQVPAVSLRYFTVYGPRQRPDMAFNRFIRAMLAGDEIIIYGDGEQTRDFTYVQDIVQANLAAAFGGPPGEVFNIASGRRISVNRVIAAMEELTGRKARVKYTGRQKGDVRDTFGDITKAQAMLDYRPEVDLMAGLAAEVAWLKGRM